LPPACALAGWRRSPQQRNNFKLPENIIHAPNPFRITSVTVLVVCVDAEREVNFLAIHGKLRIIETGSIILRCLKY
jgi:hypothetical protein